jgi:predicted ribonuclease YlaK
MVQIKLSEGECIVELLRQGGKTLDELFVYIRSNGCREITADELKAVMERLGKKEKTVFCGGVYKINNK